MGEKIQFHLAKAYNSLRGQFSIERNIVYGNITEFNRNIGNA